MFGFTSEALNASADVYLRRGKIESKYHDHSHSTDTLIIHTYIEYDCYSHSVLLYGKFYYMEKILQKCVWFAMWFAHASCNMNEILCGEMLFWFLPVSLFNRWHITEFTVLFTFWLIDCNHFLSSFLFIDSKYIGKFVFYIACRKENLESSEWVSFIFCDKWKVNQFG